METQVSIDLDNKLKLIAKKHNLKLLILFGSRISGTVKKESDWDFAFLAEKELNWKKNNSLFEELTNILKDEKIDLIDLSKVKDLILKNRIVNEGFLVYEEKSFIFQRYKRSVWFEYLDFKPNYTRRKILNLRKLRGLITENA
jgi:predicted nucleotidyltransferase